VTGAAAVATAVVFVWLGMVLAISFVEAPLKFRAPGVTIRIGLGIGRLVFRALNTAEVVYALVLVAAACVGPLPGRAIIAGAVAAVVLLAQLALVRPRLNRRSDLVLAGELAGEDAPRSSGHHAYIVLDLAKVIALLITGVMLLAR
jgi:hypothetical protein